MQGDGSKCAAFVWQEMNYGYAILARKINCMR